MALKRELDFVNDEELYYDEIPEPLGENQLSALAMFEQRKYYKELIYPDEFVAPVPFDLWYNRLLFGKVNFKGDAVFAPRTSLKQIENNVWALDFVADAFDDFKTEFLFLNKKAVEGTPYALLTPSRGWSSAVDLYDSYMDDIYDLFVSYIETNNLENNLITFADFMNILYDFINEASPNIPLTLSQFILSSNCPPTTSGLMIDISTDGHGNDIDKFNHFLNDRNFICFAQTAERFGFKIDKNFPGRLIADIESPVMNRLGDINIPPSQGGMGYMLRYPQPPKDEKIAADDQGPTWLEPLPPTDPESPHYIAPPPSFIEMPFAQGDKIGIAMIAAPRTDHAAGRDYYMLRNHTELKNRLHEPGYRPKKTNDGANWFKRLEFLVKQEKGGTMVPIYGEIISINPSDQRYESYWGAGSGPNNPDYGDGRDVALISFDRPLTTGQMGTGIGSIWYGDNSTFRGASLEVDGEGKTTGNLKVDALLDGRSTYPRVNFTSQTPGTRAYKTYAIVPLDAVHLKSDENAFVKGRFKERMDFRLKKQKYDTQIDAASRVYGAELLEYDKIIADWNIKKDANIAAWEFHENPANRLTLSNFFNRRFGSAYLSDISVLKEICMQFYYSYVRINPTTTLTKVVRCGTDSWNSKRKVVKREQITKDLINQKYSEKYWIKQYILFQNAQNSRKYSLKELKTIHRRVFEIYNKIGLRECLKYLRKKMLKRS